MAAPLPLAAVAMFRVMLDLLADLDERIADLDWKVEHRAREDETARRLTTIPGIGPITATALTALAPAAETFAKGRDSAAWLGLTPLQHSTGGRQNLGATSKMGERTLRWPLIIGASAVIKQVARRGAGLVREQRALKPGGVLAVWSSGPDLSSTVRLAKAGFAAEAVRVRANGKRGSARHVVWLATANGSTFHETEPTRRASGT